MIDHLGRNIDYLRISVTDRCNLRCIYCMPEEGVKLVDRSLILQEPELMRIVRVMAELGVTKIKLTGGEPLLRKGMERLIRQMKEIPGIKKVTLTTNGILLKDQMEALAGAGLDGLNISLDSLNEECYQKTARRNHLRETMEGISEARKYPEVSLKINCVPLGIPDQNLCDIAALAQNDPIHVRFIEMMPIGHGREFRGMSEREVTGLLQERFGALVPYDGEQLGNGPCHYYTIDGFCGKIGFISAISHKFCESCNRIRLTSQGYLKTCLQFTAGGDLRAVIRSGGTDEDLKKVILDAIDRKPEGHAFLEKAPKDDTEKLCMSQIGG